jgi:hypothetical protein
MRARSADGGFLGLGGCGDIGAVGAGVDCGRRLGRCLHAGLAGDLGVLGIGLHGCLGVLGLGVDRFLGLLGIGFHGRLGVLGVGFQGRLGFLGVGLDGSVRVLGVGLDFRLGRDRRGRGGDWRGGGGLCECGACEQTGDQGGDDFFHGTAPSGLSCQCTFHTSLSQERGTHGGC